ncbi:MAG: hypothetical protein RLZZ189_1365 [Pseudomonadota bacterium]|jgi:uncharacterized membrane protein (DUF4010 family)
MQKFFSEKLFRFIAFLTISVFAWQTLPDEYWGPNKALNPHAITEFIVTILLISALGKFSIYLLGKRYGLILTGLIGGFASSTATIYSMGVANQEDESAHSGSILGAILSNVSTLLQIILLCQLLAPQLTFLSLKPMVTGMATIMLVSFVAFRKLRNSEKIQQLSIVDSEIVDWKSLLILTFVVTSISFMSGVLFEKFGNFALPLIAAISGLADAHAVIPSLAAFVNQGSLQPKDALLPIMIAFTVNTCTKCLIAFQAGGKKFGFKVSAGLALTAAGAWLGLIF